MYLRTLSVRNFRAISHVEVEFTAGVNVIVGPNAIGKTTILEAARLPKALLAPKTSQEATQALLGLGAMSQHRPQQIILEALLQSAAEPLDIRCGYQFSSEERTILSSNVDQITMSLLRSRLNANQGPADFIAFLSSPLGAEQQKRAQEEIEKGIQRLESAEGICRLELTIDPRTGRMLTPDPVGAALIAYLDGSLPAHLTKFSYFPADRALPRGEHPIQLGSQEAQQQLESHNSQPQTKYLRLKNTVFSAVVSSEEGRDSLKNEFAKIFAGLLKGKELVGARVSEWGLLTTIIRDLDSGRTFDVDAMSSGEKGVVLTFLLIARTIERGGVVLLDEPELHLNAAVCKELLSFMVDNYVRPKDLQVILCSHSPEILAGAVQREECALFHLISGTTLTRVRQTDHALVNEALRMLGTSESEGLLYRATIFVEGEHDVELLEHGLGTLLRQYKLKDLGGRREVEKHIQALQSAEQDGVPIAPRYFIFDGDNTPTSLTSTDAVKFLQWRRKCLENYLIDIEVLCDLLMDKEVNREPARSLTEVAHRLKALAMQHLDDEVVRQIYDEFRFESPGLRTTEVSGLLFHDAAESLFVRLERIKSQVEAIDRPPWVKQFVDKCEARRRDLVIAWETRWPELCDGKRLFRDIQQAWSLRCSLLSFKKKVIDRMRLSQRSENWRTVEGHVRDLIGLDR